MAAVVVVVVVAVAVVVALAATSPFKLILNLEERASERSKAA